MVAPSGQPVTANEASAFVAGVKKGGTTESLRPLGVAAFCILPEGGRKEMGYWERVIQKISVPGLLCLAAGALLCLQSTRVCRLIWKEQGEKFIFPLKIIGLVLVLLGAVILLDFIPGL